MVSQKVKGLVCQSCGMPLEQEDDFGTAANGSKITDYCYYCFQNGAFTEPDIGMRGMIDKCVGIMTQHDIMPAAQARAFMGDVIPKLKRWQTR